ncbi:MAG: AbrB/MazE/SpoVT family DNA-binding domain-containing protein [Oscillospiraceae bacterium]|nr:AbrB/MazE/SpoVT family DNA-binding domain-containing protein [Oscillospiraceae bacterium]
MLRKRIPVSEKNQISIPIDFFKAVGVENEVDCYVQDNAIIIRPIQNNGSEFAEEILSDLISQGFSGDELLQKFKDIRRKIRPAIESLLEEASAAASGRAPYFTYKDVFGTEDADKK